MGGIDVVVNAAGGPLDLLTKKGNKLLLDHSEEEWGLKESITFLTLPTPSFSPNSLSWPSIIDVPICLQTLDHFLEKNPILFTGNLFDSTIPIAISTTSTPLLKAP